MQGKYLILPNFRVKGDENMIKTCLHCGNKTKMDLIKDHVFSKGEFENDPYHGTIQIGEWWETYNFLQCPVCERFSLEVTSGSTFEIDYDGNPVETTRLLYPTSESKIKRLPKGVKEAFTAALKVRNIDGAVSAIAIRRTLEKMCKDQDAKGKDLYKRLKNLAERGIIPPILDEMSLLIKDIGNEAAHADEVDFDEALISSLFKFTEIILEYVYVLPKELKKLQFDMSLRREEDEPEVS